MLISDAISRIRTMAGDVNVLQYENQDILNWINDGVRECALQNNLLQKTAIQNAIIGQADYDLPTDIMKLHSVKFNGQKLNVLTLEEYDSQYGDNGGQTGIAQVCYIWASKLTLHPIPSTTDELRIDYTYDPLFTTIDNIAAVEIPLPVGYHQRIVDYCLAQIAQLDDDLGRYQLKMEEFKTGVKDLKDQSEWEYDLYPHISTDSRDMGDGSVWW